MSFRFPFLLLIVFQRPSPVGLGYGSRNVREVAWSIQQTSDGGYIIAGFIEVGTDADLWLLKLDSNGSIVWQKTYGGSGQDGGYLIRTTKDGGYILAGYGDSSFSAGSWDIWVLKLTDGGAITWQKTYGGTGDDRTYSFEPTEDEGYIIAGYTHSFGPGFGDILLLKLNANGSIAWEKTFGSPSSVDYAYDVKQTSDGGYVVAGFTSSTDADTDILIMKLNSTGTLGTFFLEGFSSTIVTDTNVVATDTSITPAISTAVAADSVVTVLDTDTSIVSICGASSGPERLKIGATRKKQGDGTITSLDGLIDCPDVCEAMYSTDISTILTANPAPLSTFVGWKPTSLGCVGTEPCKVTMDKKKSVKAVFQGPNKLKVVITSKNGGAGRVTTGGVVCPGDCEELYHVGALVSLTATPTQGTFIGWTGKPCKNEPSNVCSFAMDKNVTVKAIFQGTP